MKTTSTCKAGYSVANLDICHAIANFLNDTSNRTRRIQDNTADHDVLFTATPINRDARDLLQLVSLLGADNFTDETLAILDQLERRRATTVHRGTARTVRSRP